MCLKKKTCLKSIRTKNKECLLFKYSYQCVRFMQTENHKEREKNNWHISEMGFNLRKRINEIVKIVC